MQPNHAHEMEKELKSLVMMSAHLQQMTSDLLGAENQVTKTAGARKSIRRHELLTLEQPEPVDA